MTTATLDEALNSAVVFTDGDWVESKDQDPEGDVRLIQLADIGVGQFLKRSSRFLTAQRAAELGCTLLQPGDLLVARMPDPIGRACIFPGADRPSVTVVDVCIIRCDEAKVDGRYLMHALNSPTVRRQVEGLASGSTRSRVSRRNLGKVRLRLPPVQEQGRIAAILDHADTLRAKRREVLAHLDTLTAAHFLDTFRDVDCKAPLRDIGVDFLSGKNVLASNLDSHAVNRVIKVSAMSRGTFVGSESKPMPAAYKPPDSHRLRRGDILFGRASGSLELLGATAVVDHDPENLFLPDKVWRLTTTKGAPVLTGYVLGVLRSPDARAFIRHHASGAAGVRNISKVKLLEYRAPLPSLELQYSYVAEAEAIERQRASTARGLGALDALFASLQSRAFRGEL